MPAVGYVLTLTPNQTTVWVDASQTFPVLTAGRISPAVMPAQAAIPNLNLGTLNTLAQALTALATIQTKVNTLLTELRAAGVLLP